MRSPQDTLVLSRFFYDNVKFVADMCPKCYEDSEDVRIISVNLQFIKQLNDKFYKCTRITEDFLGFTDEEIEKSEGCLENITNCLNKNKELLNKSEDKFNTSTEIKNCFNTDSNTSDTTKVRYKIYQKMYLDNYRKKFKSKNKWKKYYKTVIQKACKESKCLDDRLQTVIKAISDDDKIDESSENQENSQMQETINNSGIILVKQQTEFISSFLITDFEQEYFEKRKAGDLPELLKSWTPPRSPHNLIEECLYNDPWALLIATIFLNKTSCLAARPYVFWFLTENPDPLTVLDKFPNDLEKYFIKLGLVKTRAIQVYRMSYDFLFKEWTSVRQLYGIGDYGECAYRMFCLGDFSVEPKDRFLKIYKAWHQQCHK